MGGSETLATEVSRISMNVAAITATAINHGLCVGCQAPDVWGFEFILVSTLPHPGPSARGTLPPSGRLRLRLANNNQMNPTIAAHTNASNRSTTAGKSNEFTRTDGETDIPGPSTCALSNGSSKKRRTGTRWTTLT